MNNVESRVEQFTTEMCHDSESVVGGGTNVALNVTTSVLTVTFSRPLLRYEYYVSYFRGWD